MFNYKQTKSLLGLLGVTTLLVYFSPDHISLCQLQLPVGTSKAAGLDWLSQLSSLYWLTGCLESSPPDS